MYGCLVKITEMTQFGSKWSWTENQIGPQNSFALQFPALLCQYNYGSHDQNTPEPFPESNSDT